MFKKTSVIVQGKSTYESTILINNTALIESEDGKKGLLNIETNDIILELNYYFVRYDNNKQFFYFSKVDKEEDVEKVWIYDALENKMIVNGWELTESFDVNVRTFYLLALRDPKNNKKHLLDLYTCREEESIFDLELDGIEEFDGDYSSSNYICVTANNKKGLYLRNNYEDVHKLVFPIESDDIKKVEHSFIHTIGDKEFFEVLGRYRDGREIEKRFKSPLYDKISVDFHDKDVLYCKNGKTTDIYDTCQKVKLLSGEYRSINCIYSGESEYDNSLVYYFKDIKNGKDGLIVCNYENGVVESKVIFEQKYDHIERARDGVLYLYKDNKMGLFAGDAKAYKIVEPEYNEIKKLKMSEFYTVLKLGRNSIARFSGDEELNILVEDCKVEDESSNHIIFKKDDKYGLFDDYESIIYNYVGPNYDYIYELVENCYLFGKDGKEGVMYYNSFVVPIEYDEIKNVEKFVYNNHNYYMYFALAKNNKYEVARTLECSSRKKELDYIDNKKYDSVEFLADIMVLKDEKNIFVYDYSFKLIRTLPYNSSVFQCIRKVNGILSYFYCIDGVYYYYDDGEESLESFYTDKNEHYVTTYETDEAIYRIETQDKYEHDSFCNFIDEFGENEGEEALEDIIKNGFDRFFYPSISLTKTKK